MAKDVTTEELENIKRLLILHLYQIGTPIDNIAKAVTMSKNELYKFLPKTRKKSKRS